MAIAVRDTDAAREPWLRMPGEGPRPYDAFCTYKDLGIDRSVRAVARQLGKSETLMSRWSARWGWPMRADAWDDHLRWIKQTKQEREIEEMVEQHTRLLQRARGQLTRRLVGDEANGIMAADPNSVGFVDTVKTMIEIMNQERLVHGLPTANMRQQVTTLVNNVSNEDASVALQDPEVAAAAHELLRLVAGRKTVSIRPASIQLPAVDTADTES